MSLSPEGLRVTVALALSRQLQDCSQQQPHFFPLLTRVPSPSNPCPSRLSSLVL